MFNKYISDEISDKDFERIYNRIKELTTKKYKLKYNETKSITDNFNDYLLVLDDIYNDYDYILLNKVEILHSIICDDTETDYNENCESSYYKLIQSYNDISYERLRHNQKWLDKNNKIWRKIYSNIQIEFNFDFDMDDFLPINKLELLYNSKDI